MARLRSVKPATAIKAFEHLGFTVKRRKGIHVSTTKPSVGRPVVITDHGDLAIGTLKSNLRTTGITIDEFENALVDSVEFQLETSPILPKTPAGVCLE